MIWYIITTKYVHTYMIDTSRYQTDRRSLSTVELSTSCIESYDSETGNREAENPNSEVRGFDATDRVDIDMDLVWFLY